MNLRLKAHRRFAIAISLMTGFLLWPTSSRAEISFVDQFRGVFQKQTADGASLATIGYAFDARLHSTGAGDFDSASMTYPGPGSPETLLPRSPIELGFNAGLLASQATLDAAFPTGSYQYDADGNAGPDSTTLNYPGDTNPQSLPYLTGTNFSDLQGMNPAQDFTFEFSPFDTGVGATTSFLFFTIFDRTANALVHDIGFQPPTFTGFTLPGGLLAPNHQFTYELIFSNRVQVPSPGAEFDAQLGFDSRTQGDFVTAPEPLSVIVFAQAAFVFVALRFRRKL